MTNENGKFTVGEKSDTANRFIKLCEEFREMHRGKEEKLLGDRINYTIGAVTLEAHSSKNREFFKISGVGAYQRIFDECTYEINLDALNRYENIFINKEPSTDYSSSM